MVLTSLRKRCFLGVSTVPCTQYPSPKETVCFPLYIPLGSDREQGLYNVHHSICRAWHRAGPTVGKHLFGSAPCGLFLSPSLLLTCHCFFSAPSSPCLALSSCPVTLHLRSCLHQLQTAFSNYQTRTPGNFTCLEILVSRQQMSKWLNE